MILSGWLRKIQTPGANGCPEDSTSISQSNCECIHTLSISFLTCEISAEYDKMEQERLERLSQSQMVEDDEIPELESPLTPPSEDDASPSPSRIAGTFNRPYHLHYNIDETGIVIRNPSARVSVGKEAVKGDKGDRTDGARCDEAEIIEQMKDISLNK